ncbi:hypothetical protein BDR22DRAFT_887216 [Usnea florida]
MADANQIEPSNVALLDATTIEITLPEGFELAAYTLRRTSDGLLQSYRPPRRPLLYTGPLPATSTRTRSISLESHDSSGSLTPTPPVFNIPIRGGREKSVSATTQRRYDQSLENGYTVACGVVCPEIAPPVKKVNPGDGNYYCPRCGSNFTRPKSVKDHFPGCVQRYGNPLGLRYTDDESMPFRDAASQSRQSSSVSAQHLEPMTGVDDQGVKTEFLSAADIPLESIEFHTSTYEGHSSFRGSSVPVPSQEQTRLTPIWARPPDNGYVPAPTPPWEYGMGYVEGQTPAPWGYASRTTSPASSHSGSVTPTPSLQQSSSRTSTPGSRYSGSATPTPAQQQFLSTTTTPAPLPRSSVTPSWDASEETGGFDDGDSMEE